EQHIIKFNKSTYYNLQNKSVQLYNGNHDIGKDKPIVQLSLTEDVTTTSEDDAKYGIEVHFEKNSKLVAGWNPNNEAFNELPDYLFHFIEETLQTWREEMKEYKREMD